MGWLCREWTDKEKKDYLLKSYGQEWMDKIGWWTFENQSDTRDCYIWQLTISHDPWCLGTEKMYKTKEEAEKVMIKRFEKTILEIKELINKLKKG